MTAPEDLTGQPDTDPTSPVSSPSRARALAQRVSWAALAWAALAGVAAELGVLLLQTYRLVFDVGQVAFYAEPEPGSDPSLYNRLAALTQLTSPDRTLAVVVGGLLAVAWVASSRPVPHAVRTAGAALAAVAGTLSAALAAATAYLLVGDPQTDDGGIFYGDQVLTQVGGPLASAVVLASVSALLTRALLDAPVTGDPAPDRPAPEDPGRAHEAGAAVPPPVPVTEVPVEDEAYRPSPFARPVAAREALPPAAEQDPHAAYRRPGT